MIVEGGAHPVRAHPPQMIGRRLAESCQSSEIHAPERRVSAGAPVELANWRRDVFRNVAPQRMESRSLVIHRRGKTLLAPRREASDAAAGSPAVLPA